MPNYNSFNYMNYNNMYYQDRFGFAAPFLLGALTGGVAVGAFNPYRPRPVYYSNPYQYQYYPYY